MANVPYRLLMTKRSSDGARTFSQLLSNGNNAFQELTDMPPLEITMISKRSHLKVNLSSRKMCFPLWMKCSVREADPFQTENLTLPLLNRLRCHPTSHFQPIRLLDPFFFFFFVCFCFVFLIEIHIFNDKQCRSRSVANLSGSTLFAKTGYVVFSKRRVNILESLPVFHRRILPPHCSLRYICMHHYLVLHHYYNKDNYYRSRGQFVDI